MLTTNMKKFAAAITAIIFMSGCGQVSNDTVTTTARETEAVTTTTMTVGTETTTSVVEETTTTVVEETDEYIEEESVAELTLDLKDDFEVEETAVPEEQEEAIVTEEALAITEIGLADADAEAEEMETLAKTNSKTKKKKKTQKVGPEEVVVTAMGEEGEFRGNIIDYCDDPPAVGDAIYVTAGMLRYYGFKCSDEELFSYMPRVDKANKDGKWESPNEYYLGDPHSSVSYGCNAPVLKNTIENYFKAQKVKGFEVVDISGYTEKQIVSEVKKGNFVIIWTTKDLEKAKKSDKLSIKDGSTYQTYSNLEVRCILYYIQDRPDPYAVACTDLYWGSYSYGCSELYKNYTSVGSQAIMIKKK